ncbi:exonuclease Rex3 [Schizosaccharomyces japonicus yFS275]|uniref:Exonuclease Rex3 n=1 Tax=Schizosaccharomyces japonicus (strain yFS275 / FY16936) TaxID=402676 RepID=B6JUY2_SCHJY|nr:exonuclease Rex3 [Schizosaccharomyces japonicus yFS275]EEB05086.1 exonuclease Rex3 [Schizosaccharomyces japonicus yFS275]
MFTPLGHFKQIQCPYERSKQQCTIKHCFFRHTSSTSNLSLKELQARSYEKLVEKKLERESALTAASRVSENDDKNKLKPTPAKRPTIAEPQAVPPPKRVHIQPVASVARTPVAKPKARTPAVPLKPALKTKTNDAKSEEPVSTEPEYDYNAAAGHELRRRMAQLMYDCYDRLGYTLAESWKKALEDEALINKQSHSKMSYSSACKARIISLKKKPRKTEKSTAEQDFEALCTLVHSKEELVSWKYNMEIVTPETPPDNMHQCSRCGKHFTEAREGCTYHWGKLVREKRHGERVRVYTCCDGAYGEDRGCTKGQAHVFRHEYLPYMASVQPFRILPDTRPNNWVPWCALDCELCYTTLGMELTRLTVVTLTDKLLDTFIKPKGEILELNTRFSGIHSAEELETGITMDEMYEELYRIGVNKDTIFIGHGLENDMIAMRLVHERVIDTAILYRHEKGQPFRYSLKFLTKKYLETVIQTGEHDSEEDAVYALKLVFRLLRKEPT